MEINPRHPLIAELLNKVETETDSEEIKDIAWLLHDTALLQVRPARRAAIPFLQTVS